MQKHPILSSPAGLVKKERLEAIQKQLAEEQKALAEAKSLSQRMSIAEGLAARSSRQAGLADPPTSGARKGAALPSSTRRGLAAERQRERHQYKPDVRTASTEPGEIDGVAAHVGIEDSQLPSQQTDVGAPSTASDEFGFQSELDGLSSSQVTRNRSSSPVVAVDCEDSSKAEPAHRDSDQATQADCNLGPFASILVESDVMPTATCPTVHQSEQTHVAVDNVSSSLMDEAAADDQTTLLQKRAEEAEERCRKLDAELDRQAKELEEMSSKPAVVEQTQQPETRFLTTQSQGMQTEPQARDMTMAISIGRPGNDIGCSGDIISSPAGEEGNEGPVEVPSALKHTLSACGANFLSAVSRQAATASTQVALFGERADSNDMLWGGIIKQQSLQIARLLKEQRQLRGQADLRRILSDIGKEDGNESRAATRVLKSRVDAQTFVLDDLLNGKPAATLPRAADKLEVVALEEALAKVRTTAPHSDVMTTLSSKLNDLDALSSAAANSLPFDLLAQDMAAVTEVLLLEAERLKLVAEARDLTKNRENLVARIEATKDLCARISVGSNTFRFEFDALRLQPQEAMT